MLMTVKRLFSSDITEAYNNGQRIFKDADISFCQLGGFVLDNIVFRDCIFHYTSFRYASLKNAKFINCTFFFGSLYGADLENALFDNTQLDFLRIDGAIFDNTVFKKCSISYSTLMNTALGAASFIDCTKFKVWESIDTITEQDIADAMKVLAPSIESLDFEIRNHIKSVLEKVAGEYQLDNPFRSSPAQGQYKSSSAGKGYEKLSDILDTVIASYNAKNPYKTKTPYDREKKSSYR